MNLKQLTDLFFPCLLALHYRDRRIGIGTSYGLEGHWFEPFQKGPKAHSAFCRMGKAVKKLSRYRPEQAYGDPVG